jgi:hypothetical protein
MGHLLQEVIDGLIINTFWNTIELVIMLTRGKCQHNFLNLTFDW